MSSNIGKKFGTLTIVEKLGSTSGVGLLYRFRCDCGKMQVWYWHEVATDKRAKVCRYCREGKESIDA